MRAWLGLLLIASLTLLGTESPRASSAVEYHLAPVMQNGAVTALAVTVRFAGDDTGVTSVAWPEEWAGEHRLGQWARDIVVTGARSIEVGAGGQRRIYAAPGAAITMRYRIISAFHADPSVEDSRQPMPVVRPTWFFAVGEALFARPAGHSDDDRPARFVWDGPRSIGFASDFERANGRLTLKGISEGVVIGGRDLHVVTVGPAGREVRIARLGTYAFSGAAFDTLALKVIESERAFWRVRDAEPFLVTMTPLASRSGHVSYGGTGRADAFALWVDDTALLDQLTWLLAHEYFHTWNPGRLGQPVSAPQERGYWFSEGLTEFYAARLMIRAGLISPEAFVALWNERLRRYAGSAFRTATNDHVAAMFWTDTQADAMQYQRGALLAAIWDRELRAHRVVDGLDDVLRTQAARLSTLPKQPTAIDLFTDTARSFGLNISPDVDAYVERGEPLLLPMDTFGRCARVVTDERPAFARGWNVDATESAGNVVTGLDPKSPAYAAGLRDGMKLLARLAGVPDDSRVEYAMKVADGPDERTIRFRPIGTGRTTVQELVIDQAAFHAEPKPCALALTG